MYIFFKYYFTNGWPSKLYYGFTIIRMLGMHGRGQEYTLLSVYLSERELVIVFSFRDDDMTWRHCEILQSTKDCKLTTNVINHGGGGRQQAMPNFISGDKTRCEFNWLSWGNDEEEEFKSLFFLRSTSDDLVINVRAQLVATNTIQLDNWPHCAFVYEK